MRRYDRTRHLLALGLAFLAGEVDAVGFRVAGGYFTSFMSGNTPDTQASGKRRVR